MEIKPNFHNVLSNLDERLQSIIREDAGRYTFLDAVTAEDLISFAKSLLDHRFSRFTQIDDAVQAKDFCILQLAAEKNENFSAIFLDAKNKLIAFEKLFIGSVRYTALYPRKLFETALKHNAVSIIFVHNHPSGDVEPSQDDIQLTDRFQTFLRFIEIRLLDHIIVGGGKAYSMSEHGLV